MEQIELIMLERINPKNLFFCLNQMKEVNLNNCIVCKSKVNCSSRVSLFGNVKIKQKGVK